MRPLNEEARRSLKPDGILTTFFISMNSFIDVMRVKIEKY